MSVMHLRCSPAAIPTATPACPPCCQADQGKLLLWGAVGSPITGGMLIWRGADEDEVRSFVKKDPFVVNGLVRHW